MNVQKNAYGLTDEDLLYADDKTLNQFVSVKKIQPYRPDEGQVNMKTLKKKKSQVKKMAEKNKVILLFAYIMSLKTLPFLL